MNNEGITGNTQKGYVYIRTITAASQAILNTRFEQPEVKPDWFDELNGSLVQAQVTASDWLLNMAPKITAEIPRQVVNYASTYMVVTDEIRKIAEAHPEAKGPDDPYVMQVTELVAELKKNVGRMLEDVRQMENKLLSWHAKFQSDHDDLKSRRTKIQNAEIELKTEIDKMNNAIESLRTQIAAYNKTVAMGAGLVGLGLFTLVLGIALLPVTAGGGAVVIGTGVLGIGGGAALWGVMRKKIDNCFHEIAEDQKKLAQDQRLLVQLSNLDASTDQVVSEMEKALAAVSDLRAMWSLFEGELDDVIGKLKTSDDDDLSMNLKKTRVFEAREEWMKAVEIAHGLLDIHEEHEEKFITVA